ncbi:hypothetical protein [Streptomonospora sediminis]
MTAADDDIVTLPYDEGVLVVPLWADPHGGAPATRAGTPVDLAAGELTAAVVAELADTAVHLSAPADLSPDALDVLCDRLSEPPCFTRSGWLSGHRALVLYAGRCTIGPVTVQHHPQRGLEVAEPQGDQADGGAAAAGDEP